MTGDYITVRAVAPSYIQVALCPCDEHKIELKDLGKVLGNYLRMFSSAFAGPEDAGGIRVALFLGRYDDNGALIVEPFPPPDARTEGTES